MNNVVVRDACTIINLARIDEDEFIEEKVKKLCPYAIEKVMDEVRNRYVPSGKTSKQEIHIVPYWGGICLFANNDVLEQLEFAQSFLDYQKLNGELYSAALSLYLSRVENEKVLFYTDDNPACKTFKSFFDFQQIGYIGDSVDLLLFLYWLSPADKFSQEELKKYLTSLRGEYIVKFREVIKAIDNYASALKSSKKNEKKKFELKGLSYRLQSASSLSDEIDKCSRFFENDKSEMGKTIKKALGDITVIPQIVTKIGTTLQHINKFGVYKV